jgi:hypothetical protein
MWDGVRDHSVAFPEGALFHRVSSTLFVPYFGVSLIYCCNHEWKSYTRSAEMAYGLHRSRGCNDQS